MANAASFKATGPETANPDNNIFIITSDMLYYFQKCTGIHGI